MFKRYDTWEVSSFNLAMDEKDDSFSKLGIYEGDIIEIAKGLSRYNNLTFKRTKKKAKPLRNFRPVELGRVDIIIYEWIEEFRPKIKDGFSEVHEIIVNRAKKLFGNEYNDIHECNPVYGFCLDFETPKPLRRILDSAER